MNQAADLKIAVVGRIGQLAWELNQELARLGTVICVGRPELDLTDIDSVRASIRELRPDVLINAAAYTAVDQAESEPELAMKVNAEAPGAMAEEANGLGALFITYSSDYVFDGEKTSPYDESDVPNPLNVYGASKLAGDLAVQEAGGAYLIFRTSWVYGARGKNFLTTILKLTTQREELRIVDDQVGAPTWSRDIAVATREVIVQLVGASAGNKIRPAGELGGRRGIYNMTASGSVSWHGFAAAIGEESGKQGINKEQVARIVAIPSSQYRMRARRPMNSRLSNEKLARGFEVNLPTWRDSLTRVIEQIAEKQGTCCAIRNSESEPRN